MSKKMRWWVLKRLIENIKNKSLDDFLLGVLYFYGIYFYIQKEVDFYA